jgi:hypothetical protein
MTNCDVFQVHSGDDHGEYCSHRATAQCSDCGIRVCESHAEECEACGETFCSGCMSFHRGDHVKPPQVERLDRKRKRA